MRPTTRPNVSEKIASVAATAGGALISFALMSASGAIGTDVRAGVVTAAALLIAAYVPDRVRSALWALPFLVVTGVFATFHEALGSSPALFAVAGMGAVAFVAGRTVPPRTATLLVVPLAALAYAVQVNATALAVRADGEAVDVRALTVSSEGRVVPLLDHAESDVVFEFWNETCAPCLRNLRDLGAYRDEVEVVPVYVPFFESEPRDVRDYLDYPIRRQAVLHGDWERVGTGGVPLAVVVDDSGEVCFQGILRDRLIDVVGGTRAVLGLRC